MSCHRNLLGIALATMLAAAVFAIPAGARANGGSTAVVAAARF